MEVPPSKSVTHRVLLLSLLTERAVRVDRPLIAEDTLRLIDALRACGRRVEWEGDRLTTMPDADVAASVRPASEGSGVGMEPVAIDCGASGTLLRLLLGVVAVRPGRWVLEGAPQLRRRPVAPLVDALRRCGTPIDYLEVEGFPPLSVEGRPALTGRVGVDASRSSQYLSALILAGLGSEGGLEIEADGLISAPYVELTIDCVRRFGGRVEVEGPIYRVRPGLRPPQSLTVEGDFSAAAYFAAGAALTGGDVRLLGLSATSPQGDRRFLSLLEAMGARVEVGSETIRVRGGGGLQGIDVDLADMPDQVPTLAALAPFARGVTRISGVPHLRLKESDRLSTMTAELTRAGARVEESADGLEVPGVWAEGPAPSVPVIIETHDDHRIAMSMAVLGLRRCGVSIRRPEVVRKSFPSFWTLLERLVEHEAPTA